ncbi:sensor domain-containing diguanylate cyclase [Halomonas tibetensis]|uniref:EAL domain-containing protein n=1 Tax=Halomonas tibetensis TaxID=2259590 RepID=A0ABV7B2J3_9GAMM
MNEPNISSIQPFLKNPLRPNDVCKLFDEKERLAELHSLDILDTPADKYFDRYTHLMSEIFKVPMAAVSLIDEDRQWFKSSVGVEVRETPLEDSFCVHALARDMLEVPDTLEDDFFCHHTVVVGSPFIRFYMGTVLRGPTGQPLGTLCIMDTHSRYLSRLQRAWLVTFGHLAEKEENYLAVLHLRLNRLDEISRVNGRPTRDAMLHCLGKRLAAYDIKALAPDRLTLELTEESVLANVDKAIHTMREFRRHNITLALDDFGTGYSSLSHLKDLPMDTLKIDKSFIDDLTYDSRSANMIDGIIRIAHGLDLQVVAEGVEHEAQRNLLQEMGCDVVQGYLFSRPLLTKDALELLKRWPQAS